MTDEDSETAHVVAGDVIYDVGTMGHISERSNSDESEASETMGSIDHTSPDGFDPRFF